MAFVSDKDKENYIKRISNIKVYLANHALIGGPNWGLELSVDSQSCQILAETAVKQIKNQDMPRNYKRVWFDTKVEKCTN